MEQAEQKQHMSQEVKDKFRKQLSSAKMMLNTYKTASFFSFVLYNLRIYPSDTLQTAGTDGLTIAVNPAFFDSLSQEHRIFLLLHETLHVCLKHITRKQSRNHQLFNCAADYVINQSLKDYGISVPKMALLDSAYRGMTTEAVYEILAKDMSNQNADPDYEDLLPAGSLSQGTGQGQSQGQGQGKQQTVQEIEQAVNDILKSAETAAIFGGNGTGNLPADLARHMEELAHPKLPWYTILQNFLHETSKSSYSFSRPNRKFFPKFYLPSLHSEGLSRIDFILDTSGSISDNDFKQFITEVDKVLKQFSPEKIGFSQFDTKFWGTQMIDQFTDVTKLEYRGGGGTDITSTLKAVKDYPTKCFIIFTDGWLSTDHLPEPTIPVVWCVHGGHESFKPHFGKVIHFELESEYA